jgi:hypothetical protein
MYQRALFRWTRTLGQGETKSFNTKSEAQVYKIPKKKRYQMQAPMQDPTRLYIYLHLLVSCITTDIHLRLHSFLIRLIRRFLQPRACGGGLT